jgi:hypothetical protein
MYVINMCECVDMCIDIHTCSVCAVFAMLAMFVFVIILCYSVEKFFVRKTELEGLCCEEQKS